MNVTAIIATHNYGHWIMDAIDSVLKQTYPTNIAIFDDGSSDNTYEICKNALNINRIHKHISDNDIKLDYAYSTTHNLTNKTKINTYLIHSDKPTGGPSKPRNKLINYTWNNTDVFAPLDADDHWINSRIEKIVETFKKTDAGLVFTDYFTIDIKTGIKQTVLGESYHFGRFLQQDTIHSGACISKKILELVKEKDEFYCEQMRCVEDYDLFMRCCEKSLCIHIPEPLLYARVHQDNSTNSVKKEVWENCWKLMRERMASRNGKVQ